MTPAALGLSGDPVHEPVHVRICILTGSSGTHPAKAAVLARWSRGSHELGEPITERQQFPSRKVTPTFAHSRKDPPFGVPPRWHNMIVNAAQNWESGA
jgi:hypothetical protein